MTPQERVIAGREEARARGDLNLVRECDAQLARWGVDETITVEPEVLERATPRRGRPPRVAV